MIDGSKGSNTVLFGETRFSLKHDSKRQTHLTVNPSETLRLHPSHHNRRTDVEKYQKIKIHKSQETAQKLDSGEVMLVHCFP